MFVGTRLCSLAPPRLARAPTAAAQSSRRAWSSLVSRSRPVPRRDRPRISPGIVTATRVLPAHIVAPDYSHVEHYELDTVERDGKGAVNSAARVTLWGETEIALSRRACQLTKQILDYGGSLIKPGVTTEEVDAAVHAAIVASGAYPSPLRYEGFPKSCCTSINEVMCHGIPDNTVLRRGDIVNLDISVYLNGFHGDCSATFVVGGVTDKAAQHLVDTARACLESGIAVCGPGVPFTTIGKAIEGLANKNGLSVVPEFAGHGVGHEFHTPPFIFHFRNDEPGVMQPGMIFTIGEPEFELWRDNWTAVSSRGGWSAQFEHTLLITATGVDILTR